MQGNRPTRITVVMATQEKFASSFGHVLEMSLRFTLSSVRWQLVH